MTLLEQSIAHYFGPVAPAELRTISSFFRPESLKKGELFLETGKPCERLSFIVQGYLRIFAFTGEKEITQWVASPGYFLTDLQSFAFQAPARWNIQALHDVTLFSIHQADYQQLGEQLAQWHVLEKKFLMKCFTFLEERIHTHLALTAEERYQFFFAHHREMFNQVPQQYIASMLGMTPETFSRIRKKMAE
jgi:CRP-like cAMP-binding protein